MWFPQEVQGECGPLAALKGSQGWHIFFPISSQQAQLAYPFPDWCGTHALVHGKRSTLAPITGLWVNHKK